MYLILNLLNMPEKPKFIPPDIEDDYIPEEPSVKKISSIGQEKIIAIQDNRERRDTEELELVSLGNSIGSGLSIKSLQHLPKEALRHVSEKLGRVAEHSPDEVRKMFLRYLNTVKNTKELERIAAKLKKSVQNTEVQEENRYSDLVYSIYGDPRILRQKIVRSLLEICKQRNLLDDPNLRQLMTEVVDEQEKWVAEQKEKLQPEIEKMIAQFKTDTKQAVDEGIFPVSQSVIEERVDSLKFTIEDPVVMNFLKDRWGSYESNTHVISLSAGISPNNLYETFVHEVFHSLSGQSDIQETTLDTTESYGDTRYDTTRVGLGFNPKTRGVSDQEKTNTKNPLSLNWLNEALTEEATFDLIGVAGLYQHERELLQIMIDAGIPKDLLYRGYFDNYTVKPPGEHRTPELKKLFTFTNEKFGTGFLINLDSFITDSGKNGVKLAIEKWKEQKEKFPEFLREWVTNKRSKK